MNGGRRGPTGAPNPPPDWLATTSLPLADIPSDTTFSRIHRSDRTPIFFSPGDRQPPAGRFDSAAGLFGVFYMAFTFEGAFAETVLRNPARRMISMAEIAARTLAVLAISRGLRLVRMHGAGLQALGLDNAITTGPYEPCGVWTDALFQHPDPPDGIAYAYRHDPEQICVALFERADISLTRASDSVALTQLLPNVAAVLRRYGKGLDP
jgi:hypothetical protein